MIFTWVKSGKPDISMCLNASLAGLVAITAPCATVDALGALVIDIVAGILVDVVVEFLDFKFHIDDPVGAVGVHCANGIWGTVAEGLFNTENGLTSAYADFLPSYPGTIGGESPSKAVDLSGLEPLDLTPHLSTHTGSDKLTRVSIICKEERFPVLRDTMAALGVTGMTVSNVMGCDEGDGKIFVYNVENVVKVRTGETDYDALQDEEK